ncbi:Histone-lysine N-methyltransferase 2C [Acipenser ruthenus]|uniref:Histone-lysine N-methyltransferase 2C n=1 Tax=Acipenser ruthenus TaxID=7906 RepID=A0A444UF61_ACIRT|nr:Histone-lysine N-methyltransferase 2C [Acipenser ruthenus]
MTEKYIPSNRMSSEDKTLEPSDQGPSPAPASSTAATPAGSPAIADKRPRGRPRKDGVAPIHKSKKKSRSRGKASVDDEDSMDGVETAETESAVETGIISCRLQHCAYCKRLGATIKCCEEKCSRLYHYPCAAAAGTFQDIRSHTLLCPEHIEQATAKDEANCALCDSPGDLLDQLFCTSCGQHYHGMCLDIGVTPLKRAGWQCPDCKVCQTCKWIHLDCDRQAENETSVLLKDGYVCTICKQVEVEELQASQTCEVLETAEPIEEPEPACLEWKAVEEPGSLDHAAEENRLNEEQKPVETGRQNSSSLLFVVFCD